MGLIADFGLFTAIGLLLAMIVALALVPALATFTDFGRMQREREGHSLTKVLSRWGGISSSVAAGCCWDSAWA